MPKRAAECTHEEIVSQRYAFDPLPNVLTRAIVIAHGPGADGCQCYTAIVTTSVNLLLVLIAGAAVCVAQPVASPSVATTISLFL